MFTVNVHEAAKGGNRFAQALHLMYAQAKTRPGKIYTIEIDWDKDGTSVAFQTTSKDVFLGLGLMHPMFLQSLAFFVDDQLEQSKGSELLLDMAGSSVLITRTSAFDPVRTVFTLSPAR